MGWFSSNPLVDYVQRNNYCAGCKDYNWDRISHKECYCDKKNYYCELKHRCGSFSYNYDHDLTDRKLENNFKKVFPRDNPYEYFGYNKYITTTACLILNMPLNGEIINTIETLKKYVFNNNSELMNEYDLFGPTIINYLYNDQNKENLARVIYWKFIKPSCDFVNKNDMKSAIEYYKLMTTYLIHHYNIPYNYNYNPDIKDLNMEDLGHARKLKKA